MSQVFQSLDNETSSPFSLEKIKKILHHISESSDVEKYLKFGNEAEATGRDGGCGNDSFEVFGFLAFGLYLLNLIMNMEGEGRRGMKKRSSPDLCSLDFEPDREPALMEGALAFYTMFEGYLNALYDSKGMQVLGSRHIIHPII